ncbi:MAG: hypothetical protein H6710_04585 [Myxococcales bacterium]|nr:hypothetical protein [Myxococcales bacterium]MCB9705668.1 hypothetical protein [Myxococcales bacterium]
MSAFLFDQDDPARRGEAHGELWRAEIAELAAIRLELTIAKSAMRTADEVLRVAAMHLPILEAYHPELAAEFHGIARGAAIDPALLVVVNHYTDLRDIPRAVLGGEGAGEPEDGGCTAVYIPGIDAPVLGQTWDMHGTAAPFVRLVRIRPKSGDRELLAFTITGCLGMTGINQDGVAVTINNLTSTDARVGVVWPALVRAMLEETSAAAAHQRLMSTMLSSGHHYMIADGNDFYGVETSGQLKVLTQIGARAAHLHTNHCFDPVLRQREKVATTSTTFRRYDLATTLYVQQRPQTAAQLWDFLCSHEGYPRSICSHVDDANGDPSMSRTCGRMVMDLTRGRVLASQGCGQENPAEVYTLDRWRGGPAPEEQEAAT